MRKAIHIMVLLSLVTTNIRGAEESKGLQLTPEQQETFLSKRTSGSMFGTFNSYCSTLYAVRSTAIHTNDQSINMTRLQQNYPKFYKPTWRELFNSIARQTGSTCKYDDKLNYWVFAKPPMPLPYKIELANKWGIDDQNSYISYRPEIAPVGMDIYMMGEYSIETKNKEKELFEKIRDGLAVMFAKPFKKDVSPNDMQKEKVGEYTALHFSTTIPPNGIIWRQWAIVEKGKAFVIVSAIKPEHDKQLYADVTKMLKTFTITNNSSKRKDNPKSLHVSSLKIGKNETKFTILQDKIAINPTEDAIFSLVPKPFTLKFEGNNKKVSLFTFRSLKIKEELENTHRPVVIFKGTSQGWSGSLHTNDNPLEWYEGTQEFFIKNWTNKPEKAKKLADILKEKMGVTPQILATCRYYLSSNKFKIMPNSTSIERNISKIDKKSIKPSDKVYMAIILEEPIDETFSRIKWQIISLGFAAKDTK